MATDSTTGTTGTTGSMPGATAGRTTSSSMRPVLRVGCPMWAHTPWVGRFLSPGNRGNELAEYAGWCNAVEGNTTFYATPAPTTIAKWAAQAPGDFRFAFKVPRTVTHELRLQGGAHLALSEFLTAIEPLGARIGPVQVQLPPSFGPDGLGTLARFVDRLSPELRWVVELRHRAFFDDGPARRAVDRILADAPAGPIGRVVLDTRPLYAAPPRSEASVDERRTKPSLPVVTELMGGEPVVRVIGADPSDESLAGLTVWVPQIVAWLAEGRRPYVFVHQPENLESPALARALHAAVAELVPDLTPLPEPMPVAPTGETLGQSSLF
jgi:uncharacterized protein YecE (DUF72 family)